MSEPEPKTLIKKRVGRNVFDTPPKISVILTVHGRGTFAAETLDSIVAQKYREHEIIIVNDGSPESDRVERAIKMRIEDVIYIKQRAAGEGTALNTGIEQARGRILAFIAAGDLWQPDFLASQYVFLERNSYDMVYCDAALFCAQSAYRRSLMEKYPSAGEANFDSLLKQACTVIESAAMVRKQALVDAGMFEGGNSPGHKLHLWLRMAANGSTIGYQTKQLIKHRTRAEDSPADAFGRNERERDVYERIVQTIKLNDEQQEFASARLASLEADLAIEQGNAFLRAENYTEAAVAFRVASGFRKSWKVAMIAWFTNFAPRLLKKFYLPTRGGDIALLPRHR